MPPVLLPATSRFVLIAILGCNLIVSGATAAGDPADAIQPNSIWRGSTLTLTILERHGDTFRARVDVGRGVREVTGPVKGNTLSWLSKDVRAIKGKAAGDSAQGIINGDRIDFTYHDDKGVYGPPFTLVRVTDKSSTNPIAPSGADHKPEQSLIEVLKEQAPNAIEWALAPLDQTVPGDIRQNLTFLREDLLDEAKEKPKVSAAAYALGSQLCNTILAAFEERNQTLARAGFRAVEAGARIGVTSDALEARRNYKMSWPQFAREEAQRAELKSQAVGNAQVMAERPKLEWTQRTTAYRKTLDALYAHFRDAVRQSLEAK